MRIAAQVLWAPLVLLIPAPEALPAADFSGKAERIADGFWFRGHHT